MEVLEIDPSKVAQDVADRNIRFVRLAKVSVMQKFAYLDRGRLSLSLSVCLSVCLCVFLLPFCLCLSVWLSAAQHQQLQQTGRGMRVVPLRHHRGAAGGSSAHAGAVQSHRQEGRSQVQGKPAAGQK